MNANFAIALKLGSVFVFTVLATVVKWLADDIPAGQLVFCRSFFAMLPIGVYLVQQKMLLTALYTTNLSSHFWRSIAGVTAMALGFIALGLLPLPEVIAIGYAAPLVATGLAAVMLGETVRAYRWSAVGVGMVGVIIVLWPRLDFASLGSNGLDRHALGAAAALAGAVAVAFAMIFVRKLVQIERTATIVVYFSLISSAVGLATLPWGWVVPTFDQGLLLVGIGILGGVGQLLLTQSYRFADTSTIAPFDYSSILFGIAIGYFIFAEVPTIMMLIGSAVITGAGLFIILREHQLGLERARARKSLTPQG